MFDFICEKLGSLVTFDPCCFPLGKLERVNNDMLVVLNLIMAAVPLVASNWKSDKAPHGRMVR